MMTPLPEVIHSLPTAHIPEPPLPSFCKNKMYYLQKGLLLTSFALSILSLIPFLRIPSSLALRSVATFSSLISAKTDLSTKEHCIVKAIQCTKIAICILGLVGAVLGTPMLLVASVATDLAIQIFELGKNLLNAQLGKSLTHLFVIIVDTFLLAGFLVGSWQLMVTAAAVGIVFMLAMAIKIGIEVDNKRRPFIDILDCCCYAGLAGISLASAVMAAQVSHNDYKYSKTYKNETGHPLWFRYYDDGKWQSVTLNPGESYTFTTWNHGGIYGYYQLVNGRWRFAGELDKGILVASFYTIEKDAIPVSAFHTLPVGQSISVANETNQEGLE